MRYPVPDIMNALLRTPTLLQSFYRCTAALVLACAWANAQSPAGQPAQPPIGAPLQAPRAAAVPEAPGTSESAPQVPPDGNYVIDLGDTVKLSVFQEEDLDAEVTVSKSGEVSFPLIGQVHIAGKTIQGAEKIVWDLYDRDYLVTPKLNLTLSRYVQHTMTVTGAVLKPGQVSLPTGTRFDVISAIDAAGGHTENANLRSVSLRRAAGGGPINLDAVAMRANPASAIEIKPGDTLSVPQKVAGFVTVRGNVKKPSEVEIPDSGSIDLLTAITKAGDFDRLASKKKVLVRRVGRAEPYSLNAADMAKGAVPLFQLLPGDIITVNEAAW